MTSRTRTRLLLVVAALVVVAAVVLVWFQPQKLLYDSAVDEPLPMAAEDALDTGVVPDPEVLAAGTFVGHEHPTTGTARVLRLPDGTVVLRLEGFATTNGPDLHVYLSRTPAAGDQATIEDEYVTLGPLKGNVGDQNYAVPADVDPAAWASVVIWCDRFSASFGAADLGAGPAV